MLWKTWLSGTARKDELGEWSPKSINVAAPLRRFLHQVQVQAIKPTLLTNVAARHAATSSPSSASCPPPVPGPVRPTAATRITATAASSMPGSSSTLHYPLMCSVCRPGSRLSDSPLPPVAPRKQSLHCRLPRIPNQPHKRANTQRDVSTTPKRRNLTRIRAAQRTDSIELAGALHVSFAFCVHAKPVRARSRLPAAGDSSGTNRGGCVLGQASPLLYSTSRASGQLQLGFARVGLCGWAVGRPPGS